MKFFSADGKLYQFIIRLWDIIKLSFLWLLFSLPIVTLGGATAALAKVTMQMVSDEEGYVARDFVSAFRENFKKGMPIGLFMLLVAWAAWMDFQLAAVKEQNVMPFICMGIVLVFMFIMLFTYCFPLLARYENTILGTLKNAYKIATRYVLRTLGLAILITILLLLFQWNYTLMAIGFLIAPGSVMLLISAFALPIFRELEGE